MEVSSTTHNPVIPAKAGIPFGFFFKQENGMPAFAGMTDRGKGKGIS